MTTILNIQKRVCINPEFLDKNIKTSLFNYIKKSIKNECDKEFGYVINVIKLVKILDNYVSNNNCELIFEVKIKAEMLKPEINKVFSDKICMIFSGGIFIDICGKFKVLIPLSSLNDFKFEPSNKSFNLDKLCIKEGDEIKVKITGIKYSKQNFSCFGELVL
jgi:DNA-directed RNA polymerase subunit E'/Rpb7